MKEINNSRLIRLSRGHKVMIWWNVDTHYTTDQIRLQMHGPRDGTIGVEPLTPMEARKIARALLLAANEMEGRPTLRLVKRHSR